MPRRRRRWHRLSLADDGRIAGLPLRGEKGEKGLARDAEQRRLAQAPHGRFFNLIHEFDEVLVEGAEGVNNEGLERCVNSFRFFFNPRRGS